MGKKQVSRKLDIRALRRKLDIPQDKFWAKLGVTQSGGSRYERVRAMPLSVSILLDLIYGAELAAQKKLDDLRDHE